MKAIPTGVKEKRGGGEGKEGKSEKKNLKKRAQREPKPAISPSSSNFIKLGWTDFCEQSPGFAVEGRLGQGPSSGERLVKGLALVLDALIIFWVSKSDLTQR